MTPDIQQSDVEIEVTEEMVRAGASAIMDRWLDASPPESDAVFEQMAREAFQLMQRVQYARLHPIPPDGRWLIETQAGKTSVTRIV